MSDLPDNKTVSRATYKGALADFKRARAMFKDVDSKRRVAQQALDYEHKMRIDSHCTHGENCKENLKSMQAKIDELQCTVDALMADANGRRKRKAE